MIRKLTLTPQESLKTVLLYSQGENELHVQDHKKLDTTSLVEAGYLIPGEYANYYYCGCEGGNSAEIIWADMPNGDPPRAIARCECGIYSVKSEELRTWTAPVLPLMKRIGEAMEFKPPFTEVVPGIVWAFGRKMRREFYYVRGIGWGRDKIVRSHFAPYPTAVLIVPTDDLKKRLHELLPDNICFSVESLGAFDEEYRLTVNMESIKSEVVPVTETKKKPVARRGNRAANIEKLIAELRQHLLSARDHVYETGELLPRPSLQDLGRMAGLEKHDVTRCMKDTDAQMLRLLWKSANDTKMVRNWKG